MMNSVAEHGRRMMRGCALGVRRAVRRFGRGTDGVAAVEFALIVPVVSTLFLGAVEMSQAFTVDRRAGLVATTAADLVARANTSITTSDMSDIMRVSGYLLAPYATSPLTVTIRNVMSSPTSATTTKHSWLCTYANATLSCACNTTAYTLPTGLVSTNDAVVVAEVSYNYTPLTFDIILKRVLSKSGSAYVLTKKVYAKPRSQTAQLQVNSTTCSAPTFP